MSRVVGDIAIDVSADVGPLISGMGKGTSAVGRFGKAADNASGSINRLGNRTEQYSRRMSKGVSDSRRFALGVQNASYQIGDFAVQVGMGTNAVRAMSMQLPQLLGSFGVLGAVAGAAVAIIGPLAMRFMDVESAAERMNGALDDLSRSVGEYRTAMNAMNRPMSELIAQYGALAEAVREAQKAEAEAAKDRAMRAAQSASEAAKAFAGLTAADLRGMEARSNKADELYADMQRLQGLLTDDNARFFDFTETLAEIDRLRNSVATASEAVADFGEEFGLSGEALRDVSQAYAAFSDSAGGTVQEQVRAAGDLRDALISAYGSTVEADKAMDGLASAANKVVLEGANISAIDMTEFTSGLAAAEVQAARLERRLSNIMDHMAQDAARNLDPRESGNTLNTTFDYGRTSPFDRETPESPSGGGGGGKVADQMKARIEALTASLNTEREALESWRTESLGMLAQYNEAELEAMGVHKDAKLRIEQEYQDRLREIQQAEMSTRLGMAKSVFSDLATLMNTQSKKMFEIGKTAAIANAIVNTYEGISKALSSYPPPQSYAYAAATAAKGFAAVSAIKSQQFGGGGGGAGAASAAAPAVNTSPRVAVTMVGSENAMYSKTQVRDLINAINEEVEGGAIVRLA